MSSEEPSFYAPQQTSVNANQSQVQFDEIVVKEAEPSSSVHANETPSDSHEREQSSQFLQEEMRKSLYRAVLKNDWETVIIIFEAYPERAAILPITPERMNTLQFAIAVTAKYTILVEKLLNLEERIVQEQLAFENSNGDTALVVAALSGNVEIAKEMVKRNKLLPMIQNDRGTLPLLNAAMHKHRDMVVYLYSVTEFKGLNPAERIQLLLCTIFWDMYDEAHEILKLDRTLAIAEDKNKCTALEQLAKKSFAMSAWERFKGFWFKSIYHKASINANCPAKCSMLFPSLSQ